MLAQLHFSKIQHNNIEIKLQKVKQFTMWWKSAFSFLMIWTRGLCLQPWKWSSHFHSTNKQIMFKMFFLLYIFQGNGKCDRWVTVPWVVLPGSTCFVRGVPVPWQEGSSFQPNGYVDVRSDLYDTVYKQKKNMINFLVKISI